MRDRGKDTVFLVFPICGAIGRRVIVDLCSTSNEIRAFARFNYRNDLFRIDPWPLEFLDEFQFVMEIRWRLDLLDEKF